MKQHEVGGTGNADVLVLLVKISTRWVDLVMRTTES